MSEYDAVKHNSPPTEQEIRKLDSFQYGSPKGWVMEEMLKQYGYTPNAHDNIDTLINQNENKDYFELIKGMMPSMDTVENFVPPFGAIKLAQLASHAHNAPADETNAFLTGLKEAILGEPDPVGPQGIPFSQFMQQKKALNPKVKSIVNQHVDNLFKK